MLFILSGLPGAREPNQKNNMSALHDPNIKSEPVVGANDISLQDVIKQHVEPKFRGTEQDKLDMKILGRSQETRRMFTAISMLG